MFTTCLCRVVQACRFYVFDSRCNTTIIIIKKEQFCVNWFCLVLTLLSGATNSEEVSSTFSRTATAMSFAKKTYTLIHTMNTNASKFQKKFE